MSTLSLRSAVSRRRFLQGGLALTGATLGAGAAFIAMPAGAQSSRQPTAQSAQPSTPRGAQDPIMRTIPRTGEAVPVIGLGTFLTFDVIPGQKRDHLRQVLERFWAAGGRVCDTSPLYGTGEISVGDFSTAMGVNDGLFMANKIWATGEYLADESHARRSLVQSQNRLWRDRIDLMQVHSLINVESMLPYLRAWKKEGRIRYVGVTHYENAYHALLADWMERGELDFLQVNYSIANRQAETRLLPMAAERGVAVLTNMPFEKARLFKLVEGRPLPPFAADIGAASWAQFFLKWVVSHPAVTCALPATSDPEHAADNMRALRGPLPDRDMRARMVAYMETIPGFDAVGRQPWYPGKRYPGIIGRAQSELRART
jgi:diketogulonate reductase-like aldo/keto reductase